MFVFIFFFSSRRRHTRCSRDWSSDVCSSDPDRAVVERMAGGDQAAVRELLARYRSTVYATAYAVLVDPEQAEAVVAGTFEQAWRNAARFLSTHGSVCGWGTHLHPLHVAAVAAGRAPV